jgi:hypothetical protein
VALVRNVDGHILLNGFDLSASRPSRKPRERASANWLLRQKHIEISQAHISWEDKLLGLPRLDLQQGQLILGKTLLGHRLTLSGKPVATLGKGFDMELSWRGNDFRQWRTGRAMRGCGSMARRPACCRATWKRRPGE